MSIGKVRQKGKAGVMIVGHKEYWPQFPGEREDIIASGECFEALLERFGSEVFRYYAEDGTQMIDTPEKAFEAGIFFKKNDIDLCYIYLPSYVASGRYLIGAKQVSCPIVLVGHQVQYEVGSTTTAEGGSLGGPRRRLTNGAAPAMPCGRTRVRSSVTWATPTRACWI